MTALVFGANLKNGPFWPKLTQIWPKFGHLARLAKKNFRQKFWFFFWSKNNWGKKSTFYPSNSLFYDLPLPTLRKMFKCLKWSFFAFFTRKKFEILHFIIILVEIWLVELKLEFVTFCNTLPDLLVGGVILPNFPKKWPKSRLLSPPTLAFSPEGRKFLSILHQKC